MVLFKDLCVTLFIMAKTKKPIPTPFTFSKKWIIWSIAMFALAIFTAKDEIGTSKQLNMFFSVLGIFILFPYLIVNMRRMIKTRRRNKENSIPGFDEIDKSLLSPFAVTKMITGLGYAMFLLFAGSFVSTFFQKIEIIGIFGSLLLAIISAGMLYSRKYVFNGSKFWRKYLLFSLFTFILVDIGLLYWGTVATAIFFPMIFMYCLWIIIGVLKNRPTATGESPHKWLALALTFIPFVAIVLSAILIS